MDYKEWYLWYFDGISFVFRPNQFNFFSNNSSLTLYKAPYVLVHKIVQFFAPTITNKDLKKLVLSRYEKGESSSEIFLHWSGALCPRIVRRWCKIIRESGSLELSTSPGRSLIIRTKELIKKWRIERKKWSIEHDLFS